MAWMSSHAVCQTELSLFHPAVQDLLHCPADVHGRAWEGGSPIPSTFQWETSPRSPWRLGGAGEETVGVHVPKAESPCVNQCHLALLSETSLSQQDLPESEGDEGATASPPFSAPAPWHSGSWGGGWLRAQSPCCPACASSALLLAV